MTGREQSHRALMAGVRTGSVNALVQLGRGGENQREKKSAQERRCHERMPDAHFAREETQPHWA